MNDLTPKTKQCTDKAFALCVVVQSFLLTAWELLAIRSINAIFTHPGLNSKPKNVL